MTDKKTPYKFPVATVPARKTTPRYSSRVTALSLMADENKELKARIAELEAELAENPKPARKSSKKKTKE